MLETGKLKNIPTELKMNGLWCCWKKEKRADGSINKIPYNALTGSKAKSNDKTTFCTYPQLLHHITEYDGIGLGIFNGFSAIDIDHCVDDNGVISEMAQDIIDYCNSYTEISPSGHGIRIIFKTEENFVFNKEKYYIKNSNNGLEVYCSNQTNKFVTITGSIISTTSDIVVVNIDYILNKYMSRKDVISDALARDEKLKALWNSQAPGHGSNESELDLALCNKLAFYLSGNFDAIDQAFMKSPYYQSKDDEHKQKWMRSDYKKMTIDKAIGSITASFRTPEKVSTERSLTDTGNAKRFKRLFGETVRYNCDNKCWMIWNGKYWQNDYSNQVRNCIEILAEEMKMDLFNMSDENARKELLKAINHILNKSGKDALLAEAQSLPGIPTVNDDYDKDEWLLNCENGTVNLKTGTIQAHDKTQMLSQCTHINVDMNHEPLRFLQFLNDIFEGNQELINYVQCVLGYGCSNSAKEQEMYLFYGDGSNGKSLLLEVIGEVLGDYAVVSRSTLLTEQFNGNSSLGQIARLKGKRLVSVEELKPGDRLDESVMKSLTSGIGKIIGKLLYANEFEFTFKGKIFMATNYLPLVKGVDKGVWRRIKVIPFNKTFENESNNKNLKEELMTEKEQILGWLIKGAVSYCSGKLTVPQTVINYTSSYKTEQDIVQQWIDECCEISPAYYEKAGVLFENFRAWCFKGDIKGYNITLFGRNLVKKFERKQFSYGKVYYGIRIKREVENLERDVKFERIKVDDDI